jgi:hypothetical protein
MQAIANGDGRRSEVVWGRAEAQQVQIERVLRRSKCVRRDAEGGYDVLAAEAAAVDIGVVPADDLCKLDHRVIAVHDQHRQALVEGHDAQRVQVKPRVRDLLGVTLDDLRPGAVDAREAAYAQLLLAETRQAQARAVARDHQQTGVADLQLLDQPLRHRRQQIDARDRQTALGDRL